FVTPWGCSFPATEVIVALDTDVPAGRMTVLRATVGRGAATDGQGEQHAWSRDTTPGGLKFPATFAVVPGGAADDVATLVVEAYVELAGDGSMVHLRRLARFSFTQHTSTLLPIFLAASCGSPAPLGCGPSKTDPCTMSDYCDARGLTCDRGECVSVDVAR